MTISHDSHDLIGLRDEWSTLQEDSATDSIFMTWEWIASWWESFGARHELWLLQARDGRGRLIGVGPLMLRRHRPVVGVMWRQLEFAAASAAGDHLDLITQRGMEEVVIPAFFETLEREQNRWDVLRLEGLPGYSRNLPLLRCPNGLTREQTEAFRCPYIRLPHSFDEMLESMSRMRRRRQRRNLHQLEAACPGQWSWELVSCSDRIDQVLDELICLHQAQWQRVGKPGYFADPAMATFHRVASRRFLERGWLRLYRLVIAGRAAAVLCSYQYRGKVYAFISGRDESYTTLSVGYVLEEMALRQAIASGAREYDFLRGEERYKFHWGAQPRADYDLRWVASPRVRVEERAIEMVRSGWNQFKHLLPIGLRRRVRRRALPNSS